MAADDEENEGNLGQDVADSPMLKMRDNSSHSVHKLKSTQYSTDVKPSARVIFKNSSTGQLAFNEQTTMLPSSSVKQSSHAIGKMMTSTSKKVKKNLQQY